MPCIVYRLVRNNSPTNEDFWSEQAGKPTTRSNESEFRRRGSSVFTDRCVSERTANSPNLMDSAICQVVLPTGSGRIKLPPSIPTTRDGLTKSTTSWRTAKWWSYKSRQAHRVLDSYDVNQIFPGKDPVGGYYMGNMIDTLVPLKLDQGAAITIATDSFHRRKAVAPLKRLFRLATLTLLWRVYQARRREGSTKSPHGRKSQTS